MRKIKVPIRVITFIHKETGETKSFVFDNEHDTADSFEGNIFGHHYNCTGFWKARGAIEALGHKSVDMETSVEVEVPKGENEK